MPNVESLEQHNVNYVKDDAFEREKKAHQEHDSDNFKFLYQDCLLYTSPSPRDLSTSRMPSSA